MRKNLFYLFCLLSMQAMAQEEKLRVTFNVGDPMNFSANDIKDISFVDDDNPLDIVGSEWFCEEVGKYGTYESFEFHDDGTLTYCPYYVNYHSGYTIAGYFNFEDYMLTMQLSILGRITQAITNHSETSYVVTSGGENSIYYKVQKVYNIKSNDAPISIGNEGDEITFVDNEYVSLDGNKIKPIKGGGSGYALVKDSKLNTIVAYRINVESVKEIKDWTQYFKKTKDEIQSEFGEPFLTREEDSMDMLIYYGNDPAFTLMYFCFEKESEKMYMFQGSFTDEANMNFYKDEISGKYIKDESRSSGTISYYYDTDNQSTSSVAIAIQTSPTQIINYLDLNR